MVLIPGIQGHWQWMRPAVDALARRCRVITDSLPGERGSLARWDPKRGFDQFVDHVDLVLAAARVERAVVCGVSFGGLIALRYAAARSARVDGLVLVSAVPPAWSVPSEIDRYMKRPRMSLPLFLAGAARRARNELSATFPRRIDRVRFSARQAPALLRRPMSPVRATNRIRSMAADSFEADARAVHGPVLIVTGEPHLDRVIAPEETLRYREFIPHAEHVTLERTGHLGSMTRPDAFAELVSRFVHRCTSEIAERVSAP